MRRALAIFAVLTTLSMSGAPSTRVVTANNASCDIGIYPAATLLLPYFEVDTTQTVPSTAMNTVFTVVNTSQLPQIARVTLWTDFGFPALSFPMFLTGYGMQSISMYELVARGNLPVTYSGATPGTASAANDSNPNFLEDNHCDRSGGTLVKERRERLQRALIEGERDTGCRIGRQHAIATGYVTVDVVNSCADVDPLDPSYWTDTLLFDNVLTGDYERINPNVTTGNYAGGSPLVHIRAVPEGGPAGVVGQVPFPYTFYDRYLPAEARKMDRRQPLPSVFAARFIEGGSTGFKTNLMIWREGATGATRDECLYAKNEKLPVRTIVRFDEHENATMASSGIVLPPSSANSSVATAFPLLTAGDVGGWFWISLDNGARARASQNWITVQMYAEGRYAVDFDATWLANGCSVPPASP